MNSTEITSSGLLELHATGLASSQEERQVIDWAAQYPEVANELALIEISVENYTKAFSIQPDPSIKEKLFLKINQAELTPVIPFHNNTSLQDLPAKLYSQPFWKYAAAALLLLLLGSTAINILLYNKNASINNLLANSNLQLKSIADKNMGMEQDMQVIQSKYSLPLALNGLEAAPDAAAKIFWMKNTGEVFIDPSNLPDLPNGKNYQLWAFVEGKPVSAGIILSTKKGASFRIQKMKTFGKVEAFAVSLEEVKDTPNTSPEGPVMVMGKM